MRVWRISLVALVIGFFLWVFDQNIPFAGTKEITYNFRELNGVVSELYPRARAVNPSEETEKEGRTIIEDPVYFDVRTRVAYEKARVVVWHKNGSGREVSLGVRIPGTEWKNIVSDSPRRSHDGDWEILEEEFDLSEIPLTQNKYTFLISIPGLEYDSAKNETVIAARTYITLTRKSLWP
ncbi:hypothetical protein HY621_02250 [Candidatus Uhrbacteria bacterium]|nr:hypothetical protein [Candidatus Uhrbacteria bacterium]